MPRGENSTKLQISPGTPDKNLTSIKQVSILKPSLDIGASASIVRKDVLHKRHKILKQKKNKWSTMAGTFNTTSTMELEIQLPGLYHTTEIYAKCHLIDMIISFNLIIGRDILHELCIIFNLENKTVNLAKSFNLYETTKLYRFFFL